MGMGIRHRTEMRIAIKTTETKGFPRLYGAVATLEETNQKLFTIQATRKTEKEAIEDMEAFLVRQGYLK